MDKATPHAQRVEYPRCFVEIQTSNKLPKCVTVDMEDAKSIDIAVEYERVSPICGKCSCFGRVDILYPTKQVWQQKEKDTSMSKEAEDVEVLQDNSQASTHVGM